VHPPCPLWDRHLKPCPLPFRPILVDSDTGYCQDFTYQKKPKSGNFPISPLENTVFDCSRNAYTLITPDEDEPIGGFIAGYADPGHLIPVSCFSELPHIVVPEIIISLPDEGTVVDRMLIGVMSDTHDDIMQTKKAVSRFNREGVERVLHAGDFISPFMIDTLIELAAPLTGVFGNNDGDRPLLERKSAAFPSMKIAGTFARIDSGGMRIALLHGNDRELLETLAACGSLDLLVYGHTHLPEVRKDGPLLIVNPGEVYGHLTGRSTVALVDTVKRSAEIVEI